MSALLRYIDRNRSVFFIFILLVLALIYSWPRILTMRPQGVHVWRQTDCLSIADQYYQGDAGLLEPQMHCYISDDGTSGKTASEFPGIYYLVGQAWKVFGKHEWMYRLLSMLLFSFALWSFSRALMALVHPLVAMLFSLSFATSPVLIYYATNFLPDIHAFSFLLCGGSLYLRHAITPRRGLLRWAMFCFLLAGLFKITALVLPLVIFALMILESIGLRMRANGRIFQDHKQQLMLFFFVFSLVACWYASAIHYCSIHGGKYSFNSLWPIWEASPERVSEILDKIQSFMFGQLFSPVWFIVLFVLLAVCIYHARAIPRWMWLGFVFLVLALFAQSMLWFQALDIHDYYWITLFVFPAVVLVLFSFILSVRGDYFLRWKWGLLLLGLGFAWSVWYASNNSNMRYFVHANGRYWPNYNDDEVAFYKYYRTAYDEEWRPYETIEPYLDSIGVKKNDLVITQPDPSFNISLYLMNRRGWSAMGDESNTREGILKRIQIGAKWLLVLDRGMGPEKDFLQEFKTDSVGHYRGVSIYRLDLNTGGHP